MKTKEIVERLDNPADYYEYSIAECFLSAIINGDYSGLGNQDIKALNIFLKHKPKNGYWEVQNIDDGASFRMDEVSGLYADCYEVRLYFGTKS